MIAGVELRAERALGDLVGDSFSIFFGRWRPLVSIAVPAVVVNLAYSLVALLVEESVGLLVLVNLVGFALEFVMFVLVGGGTVTYLDEADRGQATTPADALDAAQAKLGILLGAAVRSLVIILLFAVTVIGIPFAIYRGVRWSLLSQSIMIDGQEGGSRPRPQRRPRRRGLVGYLREADRQRPRGRHPRGDRFPGLPPRFAWRRRDGHRLGDRVRNDLLRHNLHDPDLLRPQGTDG